MTHTPGPWSCSGASFGDADGIDYTIHAKGMDISKANARLITAAPELLEALRRARGTVQWAVYQHDIGTPYRKTDEEILAQIDDAIAKATQ